MHEAGQSSHPDFLSRVGTSQGQEFGTTALEFPVDHAHSLKILNAWQDLSQT